MPNCPYCNAGLSDSDIQWGTCHRCSRPLPRAELERLRAPLEEPATHMETPSPLPPQLQAEQAGVRDKDTADTQRPAQTLDYAAEPEIPRQQGEKGTADDQRTTPTRDLHGAPDDVVQRISVLWQGRFSPEATPKTSIKAEVTTFESRANLVIQPRVVQDVEATGAERPDYELLEQIGEGGMGVVLAARQASIDRTVALKMLSPDKTQDAESRRKFLSEAVVTGDLEHPNIVPIYDLGTDRSGALFYSMKRVKGTPWDSVIREKTVPENLEILMKVADAVAFAHSRGVVHRDLKPENVMLGDYGEVLLMDWGLAISVHTAGIARGVAGSPAYMAPEMAVGPVERIGVASDVYLLGAILYEIVTGRPPHTGKGVMQCLLAAARNDILTTEKSGELLDIALRAMATEPEDRYGSVGEFQEAIRAYQSHSESIALSTRAQEDLEEAQAADDYPTFARALFGFQEASALWGGNSRAKEGVTEASLAYAQSALRKGDYDLGASLLDPDNPQHVGVLRQLERARHERDARQRRLKTAKRLAAALVMTVLALITVAFFWIRGERDYAEEQKQIAVDAAETAQANEQIAWDAQERAKRDRDEADRLARETDRQAKAALKAQAAEKKQREAAEQAKRDADDAKEAAEKARDQQKYEAYIARIGLAAAKIEENAFDRANTLLVECFPSEHRDWEWGRLEHLCQQHIRAFDAKQPIEAVAFSSDGKRFATGGRGGTVRLWDTESGKPLLDIPTGAQRVFAVAFSPDGNQLAVGTNARSEYVKIFDAHTRALLHTLHGHEDAVVSVAYSRDGKRLLTASYDNTARLWDLERFKPWVRPDGSPAVFRHESWVWSAAFSPDETRIVTASQDSSASVWSVETGKAEATFLGHAGPVYAAAFSPDGKLVATGGYDKRILLWEPEDVRPFDVGALARGERIPSPEYQPLDGHTAAVRSLHFSGSGKLLLSGGNDDTIRVWDVGNRKPVKTLRGHGGRVPACVFAPRGDRVLSGSHDHFAKIWSIANYHEVRVLGSRVVLQGHSDAVLGADFSPDGRQVVSASRDRSAKLWNVSSGQEVGQYKEGHDFLVSRGLFFPDGDRILTAAVDNTVRIWDARTGIQLLMLQGTGFNAAVALSPDARWILTGSDAQRDQHGRPTGLWCAKLWDANTGSLEKTLERHRSEVTAVAVSPDNALLFTGDAEGRCRLWDAQTLEWKWEVEGYSRTITGACFLPAGDRVLTASADNTVAQWDVETGRQDPRLLIHPDAVTSMALAPDGRLLLTTCADKVARLWDIETGQQVGQIPDGGESVNAVAFSPDGGRVAGASVDGHVRIWDLADLVPGRAGSSRRNPVLSFTAAGEQVWSTAFSADGSHLLTAGGDEARLWDAHTGLPSTRFARQDSLASARFSPDGRLIVTGSWDNTAKIWNVQKGIVERKLVKGGHTGNVNDAVFSPDNTKVLTASDDHTAILWEVATGRALVRFEGHRKPVRCVAFSRPDGRRVLTASDDKTARIWDAETGKMIHELLGHDEAVLCAAFSPNGKRAITGGDDNRALLWEVDQDEVKLHVRLEGHTAGINSVAFSPNGKRVITGSQDQTAKIWDAETGKEILTLKGHTQEVTTVGFSPDSRVALTGSRDGTLILWLTADWRNQPQADMGAGAIAGPPLAQ